MSMDWIARQIQQARESGALRPPRLMSFNPRPPGVAIEGSATTAVIELLRLRPSVWLTHQQILAGINTGRPEGQLFSRVAVDWALIRLRNWEMIETCQDPRSPRYHRYRITSKGMRDD